MTLPEHLRKEIDYRINARWANDLFDHAEQFRIVAIEAVKEYHELLEKVLAEKDAEIKSLQEYVVNLNRTREKLESQPNEMTKKYEEAEKIVDTFKYDTMNGEIWL